MYIVFHCGINEWMLTVGPYTKWLYIAHLQALQEANRRLESTNREKYLIDTALNQIRLLLVDVERKRGKPYFESDPVSKQVPGMLVHTFERFVQEMNSDSDQKKSRISEVFLKGFWLSWIWGFFFAQIE